MKVWLKRIALTGLALVGYLVGLPLWRSRRGLRILRYHSVSSERFHETTVTPENFRRQMHWLKRHYRVIAPGEMATTQGTRVLITIDDGYADNFYQALPVLKEEDICALVFLVAGYVGTHNLLPHDHGESFDANRLLSWQEARQCDARHIEFGSHGWSHRRLSTLEDDGEMAQEFVQSKETIESETGHSVRFFSFPFGVAGDYDRRATARAEQAGYQAAFNAKYGDNLGLENRYDLYRIGVERSDTLFTLRAKLNGALDLLGLFETSWGRGLIRLANHMAGA